MRVLQLPPGVDPSSVDAAMSNGVLKIPVPKPANPERKLPVTVAISTIQPSAPHHEARERRPRAVPPTFGRIDLGAGRGVRHQETAIVDAVVVADEMSNLPHVDFEQVDHFALATGKPCSL